MRAMQFSGVGTPLTLVERPDPSPGRGELVIRVLACGVCRTDLHVVDGDLKAPALPLVPGHEIVGDVVAVGEGVDPARVGERVGVGWLGRACGACDYCRAGQENLCDRPQFTGYTRDGGFATHAVADARFAYRLAGKAAPEHAAPLLCAGLIGWRSLVKAGDAPVLGLYGFGAAAHIILQAAKAQGRRVFVFTRPGDEAAQALARRLGADWVGVSGEAPPEPMGAAILFAPAGELVPEALRRVRKGGRVVCAGIHMSPIPSFPYEILWGEREVVSVANLTRKDALDFLKVAPKVGIATQVTVYPLEAANRALDDLRAGRIQGAAVIVPD